MIKKISFRFSILVMIGILFFIFLYHLLIFFELIPYDMVWGGRLTSIEQMKQFEIRALLFTLLILLIIFIRGEIIKINMPELIMQITMGVLTLFFILNTIGNLFSSNIWESIIFTPITFVAAILSFRLIYSVEYV